MVNDTQSKSFSEQLAELVDYITDTGVLDEAEVWVDSSLTEDVIERVKFLATENIEEVLNSAKALKLLGHQSAAIGVLVICGNSASTLEQKTAVAKVVPDLITRLYNVRWVVAANNSIYGTIKPGKSYKRARLPSCLQQGISSVLMHADETAIVDGRGDASHPTWRDTIYTLKNRKVNWPLRSDHLDFLIKGQAETI